MKDRSKLLDQAADLVNEVLATLDQSEDECACCGLKKKRSMEEFRASTELFAVIHKLERWSQHFEETNNAGKSPAESRTT